MLLSLAPVGAAEGDSHDYYANEPEACTQAKHDYEAAQRDLADRHEREAHELSAHQEREWSELESSTTGYGAYNASDAEELQAHQEQEWHAQDARHASEREELEADWRARVEAACGGQEPGPAPGGPCEEEVARFKDAMESFRQEQDRARRDFEEEMRAGYEAFAQENHTAEEWDAFHAEREAAFTAFHERQSAEWQRWVRENQPVCEPPEHQEEPCEARVDESALSKFEASMHGEEKRFRETMELKRERFVARQKTAYAAFLQENHTEEERDAFREAQNAERDRFEEEMRDALEAFSERQRAKWETFMSEHSGECLDPGTGARHESRGGADIPEDHPCAAEMKAFERERVAFELEMEAKARAFHEDQRAAWDAFSRENHTREETEAFHARQRREAEAFHAEQERAMEAFYKDARAAYEACEERARETQDAHRRMGSFQAKPVDESTVAVSGKYVDFEVDTMNQFMRDYAVEGRVLYDTLGTDEVFTAFRFDEDKSGTRLDMKGDAVRLRIHDHPSGLMHLRASDGHAFILDYADDLTLTPLGDRAVSLKADGFTARLKVTEGNYTLEDGNVVVVEGDAVFRIRAENAVLADAANKHRDDIEDAVDAGHVGAESTVVAANESAGTDGASDDAQDVKAETLVFEDVHVAVHELRADGTIALEISSEQEEPKTVVVNLDKALLPALIDGNGTVEVRYFEVAEDNASEEEVTITMAASLEDVLDPTDDDGAPEYLVVVGEDGVQLLVSVPHFSTKRVEVRAVDAQGEPLAETPAPGVWSVLAAILAVAAAAGRRRR